jgi:L-2-hydroxyglutarate oxidase
VKIIPLRGEYYDRIPERHYLVRGLIYPTLDRRISFLGVHFTQRIHGGLDAGSAVRAQAVSPDGSLVEGFQFV